MARKTVTIGLVICLTVGAWGELFNPTPAKNGLTLEVTAGTQGTETQMEGGGSSPYTIYVFKIKDSGKRLSAFDGTFQGSLLFRVMTTGEGSGMVSTASYATSPDGLRQSATRLGSIDGLIIPPNSLLTVTNQATTNTVPLPDQNIMVLGSQWHYVAAVTGTGVAFPEAGLPLFQGVTTGAMPVFSLDIVEVGDGNLYHFAYQPTPTPTPSPTPTPTDGPTPTPTPTTSPDNNPTPTPTPEVSATPTTGEDPTPTPSLTEVPDIDPSPTCFGSGGPLLMVFCLLYMLIAGSAFCGEDRCRNRRSL